MELLGKQRYLAVHQQVLASEDRLREISSFCCAIKQRYRQTSSELSETTPTKNDSSLPGEQDINAPNVLSAYSCKRMT